MAKVITFSRTFPAYHPRKGEPTYFVEKFLKNIGVDYMNDKYLQSLLTLNAKNLALNKLSYEDIESFWLSLQNVEEGKSHTIREGHRFEFMDFFSPRCWFGRPYFDPQIIFSLDISIKNVWDFSKDLISKDFYLNGIRLQEPHFMHAIAANDGLSLDDLLDWFKYPKPFTGQIICWNENINY